MFKTSVAMLREQLRESQRREHAYLRMLSELNDRLANAYGHPWTLPPRPQDDDPFAPLDVYQPLQDDESDAPILIDI